MKSLIEFYKTHDWCQGTSARNANREQVSFRDGSAVAFCPIGACWVLGISTITLIKAAGEECKRLGFKNASPVLKLNDDTWKTKGDLMEFLERYKL